MDEFIKTCAVTAIAVVLCVLLRNTQTPMSVLLSIAICMGIFCAGLAVLTPIFEVIEQMKTIAGLSDELSKPMMKVVGICLLSNIMTGICEDAGESALGKTLETTGVLLSIYASLPLVLAAMELIENLMRGMP